MKLDRLLNYLLEEHERRHMSKVPLGDIKDVPVEKQRTSASKPDGFWYDCDNEWSNWVEFEMPDWKGDYVYSVKLDHSKMKVIRNFEDLKVFSEEYASDISDGMINWQEVARRYSGIEICPYIREARNAYAYDWYYGWDIASGCIWRRDAIVAIEAIPKS